MDVLTPRVSVRHIARWLLSISQEYGKESTFWRKVTRPRPLRRSRLILKMIEKAHRNDEVEQEPSGNKKPEEPAHNPNDITKCRLNEHNHLVWKNCSNNPNSKNYNGTHYSKI